MSEAKLVGKAERFRLEQKFNDVSIIFTLKSDREAANFYDYVQAMIKTGVVSLEFRTIGQ